MAAPKKRKKNLEERLDIEVPAIPKLDIDYGGAGGGSYVPATVGPLDDAFLPTRGPNEAPLGKSYEERVQWMGYMLISDIQIARKKWKGKVDRVTLTVHRPNYQSGLLEAYMDPSNLPTVPELRKKYDVINYKGREFVLFRYGSNDTHPDPWFVKRSEIS